MVEQVTIKIFSLTQGICKLIAKILDKYNFRHDCIIVNDADTRELLEEKMDSGILNPGVLIVDKEIPVSLKEVIVGKYPGTEIICLPSLDVTDGFESKMIQHISEPLRLSEFESVLLKITKRDRK